MTPKLCNFGTQNGPQNQLNLGIPMAVLRASLGECPRSFPREPKTCPREAQDTPRRPKTGSRPAKTSTSQVHECSKGVEERPQKAQNNLRQAQVLFKQGKGVSPVLCSSTSKTALGKTRFFTNWGFCSSSSWGD